MKPLVPILSLAFVVGLVLLHFTDGPARVRIGPLELDLSMPQLPHPFGDVESVESGSATSAVDLDGPDLPSPHVKRYEEMERECVVAALDTSDWICWPVREAPVRDAMGGAMGGADTEIRRRIRLLLDPPGSSRPPSRLIERLIDLETGLERERRRLLFASPTVS